MNSTLAERFRQMRQMRDKTTQDELAEIMGVKRSRIADIERGKVRELKAEEIVKLQERLQVSGWWLMTGEGSAETSTETVNEPPVSRHLKEERAKRETSTPITGKSPLAETILAQEDYYIVETDRFEPQVPQGAKLLLDRIGTPKDGNHLLIENAHGVYIKQYQIDLGEEEGRVVLKKNPETCATLTEIAASGGRLLGIVRGFLKEF